MSDAHIRRFKDIYPECWQGCLIVDSIEEVDKQLAFVEDGIVLIKVENIRIRTYPSNQVIEESLC